MCDKRLLSLALALALGLGTLGCEDRSDPLSPVDPQFAAGGKPGKPTSEDKVELLEYYVYQEDGSNFVHILAAGSSPMVNLNVVQDYFFNGIRDDDYSIHYEYTTSAPLPVSVEELGEIDPDAGTFHIDIPWNGETYLRDLTDPNNPVYLPINFPDFPHADLDGSGADPFAFDIRFQKENGDFIAGYQPQGIILEGEPAGAASLDIVPTLHGEVTRVYSYATVSTTQAGKPVYIDDITLDESSVTCEVRTFVERVGKERIKREVTYVTGLASVVVLNELGEIPEAWLEVMFARPTGDLDSPEIVDSFQTTHDSEPWAEGWGASAQFDGAYSSLDLQLAVTYVYATDLEGGFVYAPAMNTVPQEGSWYTINAGPLSEDDLGKFPIALTQPVTVDCRK